MSKMERFFLWTERQSPESIVSALVLIVFAFWAVCIVSCLAVWP